MRVPEGLDEPSLCACWNCGAYKLLPEMECIICRRTPSTVPELTASILLCHKVISLQELPLFIKRITSLGPWLPSYDIMKSVSQLNLAAAAAAGNAAETVLHAHFNNAVVMAMVQRDAEMSTRQLMGVGQSAPPTAQPSGGRFLFIAISIILVVIVLILVAKP